MELKAYLVQRGRKNTREYKKGIDALVEFDYMGSSEFEWGALPKSLRAIRENIDQYTVQNMVLNGVEFTILATHTQFDEIALYMSRLANGEFRTKERTDFNYFIYPDTYPFKERYWVTDFWWDIENNLMWWKADDEFTIAFLEKLKTKPE
jgi:hypothetical protein